MLEWKITLELEAVLLRTEEWESKEIWVSVRKIQELTNFKSATINSVSGSVRTKSKIRDIRRAGSSVRNPNRLSRKIGKGDIDPEVKNRLSSSLNFSFRGVRVDIEIRCYSNHEVIEENGRGIG